MSRSYHRTSVHTTRESQTLNSYAEMESSETNGFKFGLDMLDDIPSLDMLDELEESLVTVNTRARILDISRK